MRVRLRVLQGLGFKVVISRVISRVTILITHIKGLITPLRTTHEPPSTEVKPTLAHGGSALGLGMA